MKNAHSFLIIDDDNDDVDLFCEVIKTTYPDARCLSAKDGRKGLKLLRSKGTALPDLIFLDLNMPMMDGLTCLAELKKDPVLMNIPVIIYTTSDHHKDRKEADRLGAAYYLVKPTSFRRLCDEIKEAVDAVSVGNGF